MAQDVQPISGTTALVAARLCNFETGSAQPLPSHTQWLSQNVKPILASKSNAWIDLLGYASRQWKHTQGQNSHQLNTDLSIARCTSVKSVVLGFNPTSTFNIEFGKGYAESQMPNPDDGYDRAVEIYVYASKADRPPPLPKPPRPESRLFEIRVVGGGSASAGVQFDNYFFQIVDLLRFQTAFFFYTGAGLGISIPKIPGPGSVTKIGPPTKFTTSREAQLYMFNSRAALYQDAGATLGPYSVGGTMRLAIKDIHDDLGYIGTHPGNIPIEGGAGIQMPGLGSASEGVLSMASDVFKFSGY